MSNVGKLQLNSLIATDISSQDMSIQQNRDIITLALTLLVKAYLVKAYHEEVAASYDNSKL